MVFNQGRRERKPRRPALVALYERLRQFRLDWEAAGGTRGTLRKARKAGRTLFPELPKGKGEE